MKAPHAKRTQRKEDKQRHQESRPRKLHVTGNVEGHSMVSGKLVQGEECGGQSLKGCLKTAYKGIVSHVKEFGVYPRGNKAKKFYGQTYSGLTEGKQNKVRQ